MTDTPSGAPVDRLITLMARLPGLGPRSARRAALALLKKRDSLLEPLAEALTETARSTQFCEVCGNIAAGPRCDVCLDPRRDPSAICVVEEVGDLWALERAGAFRGRYHVLGGTLSALDGVGPDDLRIPALTSRAAAPEVSEVVLALNATLDGRATAHYVADALVELGAAAPRVSALAQGVPLGGELDYLDDGTLSAAFSGRKTF